MAVPVSASYGGNSIVPTRFENKKLQQLLKPKWVKYIPHQPYPKQQAFLWLTCLEAFFGGAVGGGKSDAILMAALQYVDCPGYAALILRDTYTNLTKPEGLLTRAHEWLAPWIQAGEVRWVEKTSTFHFILYGSTLSFGYLDGPRDHFNFMSAAYHFVGIDEVVGIRKHQAMFLFSRMRRLKTLKHVPIRFRCASNPPVFGQLERGEWVKERYVNKETKEPGSVYIPAKLSDNYAIDADDYLNTLSRGLDAITFRQLKDGDWEIQPEDRFFKVGNIRFMNLDEVPDQLISHYVRRWDMAATEAKKGKSEDNQPAYTAGVKGCYYDNTFIVVDVDHQRLLPGDADKNIRTTAEADGLKTTQTCEQEPGSSGKRDMWNVANFLKGFSFAAYPSTGSKIVRARPLSAWMNLGRVVFVRGKWNKAAISELRAFPDGKFKDIVDAMAGCFQDVCGNTNINASDIVTIASHQSKIQSELSYLND